MSPSASAPLPIVAVATTLILLLSGCTGGSPAALPTISTSPAAADTGIVEGTVLSEEVVPIDGAHVGLQADPTVRTQTDFAGAFRLPGLPPGPQKLLVQKEGYKPGSVDVTVVPGEVAQAKITLKAVPVSVPREVSFIFNGYLGSDIAVPAGNQYGPGPAGETKRSVYYAVEQPDLLAVHTGIQWTGNLPTLSNRMYMLLFLALDPKLQCDDAARTYCLPMTFAEGQSPLANGSADYQENMRDRKDLRINLRFKMRPCVTGDVGPSWVNPSKCPNPVDMVKVAVDQKVTGYTTLFYGMPAPPGYSAVPPA